MGPALIICSLLLSLAPISCTSPPPPRRPDWNHQDGIEQLLRLNEADWRALEDLTAKASIALRQSQRRDKATAFIFFKRPDLFRVDVRGPLYTSIFTVILQEDSLAVLPSDGRGWKGTAQGPLLAQLTGIDLGQYDLIFALLGLVEPGQLDVDQAIQFPRADRAIAVLVGGDLRRHIWVDLHRGFITREEVRRSDGTLVWYRLLSDYRRVGRLYLPARVEIHQGENSLSLVYDKFELDQGLQEKTFTKGIPSADLQRLD